MPSAVFTSVTGTFTFSVSVDAPLAYDPPATATFAIVSVSETSWNIGVAAGKFAPVITVSLEPLTEITADVGGGVGGAGGAFGGFELPVPFEPVPPPVVPLLVDEVVGPPAWNGSLLSKSEKDCSWPTFAGACTAETSCCEIEPDEAVGVTPLTAGVAGTGVDGAGVDVAVVVTTGAASGFEPLPLFRDIIVWTP